MGVRKINNSLVLDVSVEGLPSDWRHKVEAAVTHAAKLYSLYATSVQAGLTGNPPQVLVSISRQGAEEAWTERAEATLRARVIQVLEMAREEEAVRQAAIAQLEAGLVRPRASVARRIVALERERDKATMRSLNAKRNVVLVEIKTAMTQADLAPAAADLARLALSRMKEPGRFALWAQLLMAVDETAQALGPDMERRLKSLL